MAAALLAGCTDAPAADVNLPIARMSMEKVQQRVDQLMIDGGGTSSSVELRGNKTHYEFLATYSEGGRQMIACGSATDAGAEVRAAIAAERVAVGAAQALGVPNVQMVARAFGSDKGPGTYLRFVLSAPPAYPKSLWGQIACKETWQIEVYAVESETRKISEFTLPFSG